MDRTALTKAYIEVEQLFFSHPVYIKHGKLELLAPSIKTTRDDVVVRLDPDTGKDEYDEDNKLLIEPRKKPFTIKEMFGSVKPRLNWTHPTIT